MDRVHREKSYWVCQQPDCKGRCIQTENELISTQEHNHCPDSAAIEVSSLSFLLSVSVSEFLRKLSVTCGVGQWSCRRVGCR